MSQIRHLTVGKDVFAYTDTGVGTPVLFLHGALGDLRTWRRQCAALSARFRCIAYTQRYFGTNPWSPDGPPFGTRTHAADLIAFCEALGTGPVAVVAWSYAGHAALQAALARPELFSRMLVFEPGVPTCVSDPDELAAFGQDAQAMFGPVFEAAGRGDLDEAVRRLIDASGGEAGYFDRQSAERRAIERDNAHSMPLLLAQEPPPPIACEELGALRIPVSIVWGGRSRPVFTVPSRAAARCIRTGNHTEIPDVGHLWPDEDPDGFAAKIGEWMDGRL
ncbi:alpha/beta fold hydrolase [Azospirillum soli]|uniref:alpha/beta fold hydrolase n=1 Tax=Azospirillum soli TaxID=1304799 RepID=UPI001AE4A627|nr:alpha/beta hydrolase [Azospirillum soli]MBP2311444.1 pimeloyl-ACP methyl ester carboxylesterase [Azospirillum soli]